MINLPYLLQLSVKSLSKRIDEFIKDEVKKVEGLANPLAIPYNRVNTNSIMSQTSLSLLRNFDTIRNSYKKMQSEIQSLDDFNEADRYLRNARGGLDICKPNIGRVLTTNERR